MCKRSERGGLTGQLCLRTDLKTSLRKGLINFKSDKIRWLRAGPVRRGLSTVLSTLQVRGEV